MVGQRTQQEVVVGEGAPDKTVATGQLHVVLGDAADQVLGQGVGVGQLGELPQGIDQGCAHVFGCAQLIEHGGPSFRNGECLGEQLVEVMDDDTFVPQRPGERVVLLACPLHPQDVVEEQFVDVRRRETGEFEPGPVHDHLSQSTDLGMDTEL